MASKSIPPRRGRWQRPCTQRISLHAMRMVLAVTLNWTTPPPGDEVELIIAIESNSRIRNTCSTIGLVQEPVDARTPKHAPTQNIDAGDDHHARSIRDDQLPGTQHLRFRGPNRARKRRCTTLQLRIAIRW